MMLNTTLILKQFAHNQCCLHPWVPNIAVIKIHIFLLQKTDLYAELAVRMCINRLTSRTVGERLTSEHSA